MDKKITIEVRSSEGDPPYTASGWLEDWILSIYFALDPLQQAAVRQNLEERATREKR